MFLFSGTRNQNGDPPKEISTETEYLKRARKGGGHKGKYSPRSSWQPSEQYIFRECYEMKSPSPQIFPCRNRRSESLKKASKKLFLFVGQTQAVYIARSGTTKHFVGIRESDCIVCKIFLTFSADVGLNYKASTCLTVFCNF